ncbi:hypothetical protein, partial [Bacillus pumilus]|uniref:hypothetical protein n=1 Tax=Bacillus pumilus TaxID=1408 RepID=UPI0011A1F101
MSKSKDVANLSPVELIKAIEEEISSIENDVQKGISYTLLGLDRQSSFESMFERLEKIETLCKQI